MDESKVPLLHTDIHIVEPKVTNNDVVANFTDDKFEVTFLGIKYTLDHRATAQDLISAFNKKGILLEDISDLSERFIARGYHLKVMNGLEFNYNKNHYRIFFRGAKFSFKEWMYCLAGVWDFPQAIVWRMPFTHVDEIIAFVAKYEKEDIVTFPTIVRLYNAFDFIRNTYRSDDIETTMKDLEKTRQAY